MNNDAVKRGVQLLNARVPNWRWTLRRHQDELDMADNDYCVLGLLEHHNSRLRHLRVACPSATGYNRACARLGIVGLGSDYGFVAQVAKGLTCRVLQTQWQAEFK